MRIGYLECFSGISGDMLLGALVDAGVPFDLLAETAAALNVGARLEMRKVSRGGLAATKVDVLTPEQQADRGAEAHAARGHPHARTRITPATRTRSPCRRIAKHTRTRRTAISRRFSKSFAPRRLSEAVKVRSIRAFQLLGEAEAAIHSIPIEKVHFHEVGAVDTIVDIVCAAAGCEALGVDRWLASPLNVGSGTVKCQHGTLPVPAPATLALLGDAPVYSAGPPMERVTPTGAAVLRMLEVRYAPLPAMRVKAAGYGAGGRDTPGEPNLLRLLVGEADESSRRRSRNRAECRAHRRHRNGDRRLHAAVAGLRERVAARSRRLGRLSRGRADEEGPHRRADHRALQSRTRARAARAAAARDHLDRPALAHRKQVGPGARIRRGRDAVGQGAHQDCALALRRGGQRLAGVRRLPRAGPRASRSAQAGDAGGHARLRGPGRRTADGSPVH